MCNSTNCSLMVREGELLMFLLTTVLCVCMCEGSASILTLVSVRHSQIPQVQMPRPEHSTESNPNL